MYCFSHFTLLSKMLKNKPSENFINFIYKEQNAHWPSQNELKHFLVVTKLKTFLIERNLKENSNFQYVLLFFKSCYIKALYLNSSVVQYRNRVF